MESAQTALRDVFDEAAEIADPAARAAFLDSACRGNVPLRARVEELLRAEAQATGFLRDRSTSPENDRTQEKIGERIGRYRLRERIGRGGCGVVYLADQEEPVRREVALKVIKLGMDTRSVVARFEAERQTLALMDHPNIARVFDAGATETGRPYFVMELVRGVPITDFCERHGLSFGRRLELFTQICQAVQHAHQKGIIHRDLKPSNILVGTQDGAAVPKVIDFGIAKATEQGPGHAGLTNLNHFIGTPAYMSPEQVGLGAGDVDTRSDIYSLGVILYELLTGQPPFDPKTLTQAGLDQMRRIIREVEPVKPSTRITQELGAAGVNRRKPNSALSTQHSAIPSDLDWIVMKCLEKDRARRYETANGLASDIRRHLNNEPVVARPPSPIYLFQKLFRRHRTAFASAGIIALVLVAAVVVSTRLAVRATRAEKVQTQLRADAQSQASETRQSLVRLRVAEGNRLVEQGDLLSALPSFVAALQMEQRDPAREENERMRIGWVLRNTPALKQSIFHGQRINTLAFSPDGTKIAAGGDEKQARVWNVETGEQLAALPRLHGSMRLIQFSPDHERLVAVNDYGAALILNASNGEAVSPVLQLSDVTLAEMYAVLDTFAPRASFSPDGNYLIGAWASKSAHIWNAMNGTNVFTLAHPQLLVNAEFSPDSRYVVTCCRDRLARIWDVATGKRTATPPISSSGSVSDAHFDPTGTRLLTVANRKDLQLWDWKTALPIGQAMKHEAAITVALFTLNGDRVITAGGDGVVRVWSTDNGQVVARFQHPAAVNSVALSPNGKWMATACDDGYTRVWDIAREHLAIPLLPQGGEVRSVAFSRDGNRLAAAGVGGMIRLWELRLPEAPAVTFDEPDAVWADFSRDGAKVATAGRHFSTAARVWDASTGTPLTAWLPHQDALRVATFSPDGTRILTDGEGSTALIWDAKTGQKAAGPFEHPKRLFDAIWSPNGRRILTACNDGAGYLWDAATGERLFTLQHSDEVHAVAFSPDGKLVATGSRDRTARIWDAATGRPVSPPLPQSAAVHRLRFSPDSLRLVTSCYREDATHSQAELWEVASGKLLGTMPNRDDLIMIEFSNDGRRIATACKDRTARVWDGFTCAPVTQPLVHAHEVYHALFSPDERRLATLTIGGDVRLWSTETGEPITPPIPHPHGHQRGRLCFSPDGRRLLIASGGPGAYLREFVPEKASLAELKLEAEILSGKTLDSGSIGSFDSASLSNAWIRLKAR
jgi:WD40 repeat protein/serine/threonine protein kinase